MNLKKPQKIKGISEISDKFDVYFVDLWGVIHNGVQCYPAALKVLEKLKEQNKKIVLISNAPRPSSVVQIFLETIGLQSLYYDFLVTSGDITRGYISANSSKKKFYHLGPAKDIDLFKNLNVKLFNKEECDEIICTGLVSDEEEKLQRSKSISVLFFSYSSSPSSVS
jgi:ribonucleotide monophosphatase NagD (HAD superfamily)